METPLDLEFIQDLLEIRATNLEKLGRAEEARAVRARVPAMPEVASLRSPLEEEPPDYLDLSSSLRSTMARPRVGPVDVAWWRWDPSHAEPSQVSQRFELTQDRAGLWFVTFVITPDIEVRTTGYPSRAAALAALGEISAQGPTDPMGM
jgi:hypothetical protein